MIYRVLDIGVFDRDLPDMRGWVSASSAPEAVERMTTAVCWYFGCQRDQVCLGNVDCTIDIERNWEQGSDAGDRRWIQYGSSGRLPLYDHDDDLVLYLVTPKDRARLRLAYQAAADHERELAAVDPDYAGYVDRWAALDKAKTAELLMRY